MTGTNSNRILMFVGLAYFVTTFAIIFFSILAPRGILSLSIPAFIILFPLIAIIVTLAAPIHQFRFHWAAQLAFVLWIIFTAFLQLMVFCQAIASV